MHPQRRKRLGVGTGIDPPAGNDHPIIRERFAELVVEHECLCDHVLLVAPADIAHHIQKTCPSISDLLNPPTPSAPRRRRWAAHGLYTVALVTRPAL